MMQLSIFEANSMVRRDDPDTSALAAVRAVEFRAGQESKIFAAICEAGNQGANAKEISAAIKVMTDVQVNRRLSKMGERRLIKRLTNTDGKYFERDGCAVWFKA